MHCSGINDHMVIQDALSQCPVVILSSGTFHVDTTSALDSGVFAAVAMPSNSVLLGSGKGLTTIRLKDNASNQTANNCTVVMNRDMTNGNSNITIAHLTIDGNRQGQPLSMNHEFLLR